MWTNANLMEHQINKCQQTIITFPPELKMTSVCMVSEAALAIVMRMK